MYKQILIGRQEFLSRIDTRTNTLAVTSIHPYDETSYHWARQNTDGTWNIYRNGKKVTTVTEQMTEEQIAQELLNHDKSANLKPRTAIW